MLARRCQVSGPLRVCQNIDGAILLVIQGAPGMILFPTPQILVVIDLLIPDTKIIDQIFKLYLQLFYDNNICCPLYLYL